MITQEILHDFFYYDELGFLRRKKKVKGVKKSDFDKPVGCNSEKFEYIVVGVNGKTYLGHVLIWMYHNGAKPVGYDIDHINGNKKDNRIENLRIATRSENNQNRKECNKNNKQEEKGIRKQGNKYRASIMINRKSIHLGYFCSIEDAISARKKAEAEHHTFMFNDL